MIVVTVALVGCGSANGGKQSTRSPGTVLTAAVSRLQSSSAHTVHVTGVISAGAFGTLKVSGDEQFSPRQAEDMKVDISGSTLPTGVSGSMETILVDGAIYENVGPDGKPWVKFDPKALSSPTNMAGTPQISGLEGSADPAQQMKLLLTSANLKRTGSQTVDGTQTTHYAGDIDPAKMAEPSGNLSADQVAALKTAFQQAGISTEHIDLWLRKDDLPMELRVSASTTTGKFDSDMHYSKWGESVTISAPPADQVLQLTEPPYS